MHGEKRQAMRRKKCRNADNGTRLSFRFGEAVCVLRRENFSLYLNFEIEPCSTQACNYSSNTSKALICIQAKTNEFSDAKVYYIISL